jgi:hypothetical protein
MNEGKNGRIIGVSTVVQIPPAMQPAATCLKIQFWTAIKNVVCDTVEEGHTVPTFRTTFLVKACGNVLA